MAALCPSQRRWMLLWHSPAACTPNTANSQCCWRGFWAAQGGCDCSGEEAPTPSCNPRVWKAAWDVPGAACSPAHIHTSAPWSHPGVVFPKEL